jgi:hypothetical protein
MSYNHLTIEERNVIYRMRLQGYADAEIARCLGCHRSTVGRERERNATLRSRQCPDLGLQPPAGPSAAAQDGPSTLDGVCRRASDRTLVAGTNCRPTLSPAAGIMLFGGLALHRLPRYPEGAVAEDRALLGSNPSAVTTQGQGRRGHSTTSPCPLILSLAQSAKSQGPGDSVPRTTE